MKDSLPNKYLCLLMGFIFILISVSFLLSCRSKYISINQAENIEGLKINKVAIIPFTSDGMRSDSENINVTEGASILTRLMERKLDPFYYLITREKVAALLPDLKSLRAHQIATMLGRKLEVDAVLMGMVTRYQSREGKDYAVSQPASVAFKLYLLESKKGDILWSARFDKTQKPLSEDLSNISSFIQGEWRWLTAEELMELGVNQILDKFPGMRERQEQKKLKPLSSPLSLDIG